MPYSISDIVPTKADEDISVQVGLVLALVSRKTFPFLVPTSNVVVPVVYFETAKAEGEFVRNAFITDMSSAIVTKLEDALESRSENQDDHVEIVLFEDTAQL